MFSSVINQRYKCVYGLFPVQPKQPFNSHSSSKNGKLKQVSATSDDDLNKVHGNFPIICTKNGNT